MNELQEFRFEGSAVRTVQIGNEPYFVGKDVAEVLGYAKARNALQAHVDAEDKKEAPIQGALGGTQSMTIINESGLYSLILGSKLPSAKRFKRWVTAEVLPALRKHGVYADAQTAERLMNDPDFMIKTFQALKEERERRQALEIQNAEMKPKAIFADAVAASNTSILVGDLAKILKQNGIEMGQKRLFEWLRSRGYLIKRKGADWNSPTQRSMEMGLFEIKETAITHSDGHVTTNRTTKVTGRGQQYFINLFLKEAAA